MFEIDPISFVLGYVASLILVNSVSSLVFPKGNNHEDVSTSHDCDSASN